MTLEIKDVNIYQKHSLTDYIIFAYVMYSFRQLETIFRPLDASTYQNQNGIIF